MAENRQVYDEAMAQGRELQTNSQWEKAFREFYKAASEFKSDVAARVGMAQTLAKLNRYDQALNQYQGLVKMRPTDPDILRGYAETLAQLDRKAEAIDAFYKLRDIAKDQQQPIQRIEALSEIIGLDESRTDAYEEIVEVYITEGDNSSAAAVGVELARYYNRIGQTQQALEILNDVVQLDPSNPDAHTLMTEWEDGSATVIAPPRVAAPEPDLDDLPDLDALESLVSATGPGGYTAPSKPTPPRPVEETPQPTFGDDLTNAVSPAPTADLVSGTQKLITEAELSLERGEIGKAIRHYEMAIEAGADGADIHYSLGQLYTQQGQHQQAVEQLRKATLDMDYAASAWFALGSAYEGMGDLEEAGNAYEEALRQIDLTQIGENEVDELIDMYDVAANAYQKIGNEVKAASLYTKLAGFVSGKGFRTEKSTLVLIKAREMSEKAVRERVITGRLQGEEAPPASRSPMTKLEEDLAIAFGDGESITGSTLPGFSSSISFLGGEGDFLKPLNGNGAASSNGLSGLDLLDEGVSGSKLSTLLEPAVATMPAMLTVQPIFPSHLIEIEPNALAMPYLRASEDFMKRDLLQAAMDACHEMIRYFPGYLPAQAILAELFVKKGWLEQARTKYQFIVDLYNTRDDTTKSIQAYRRLADISPDNMPLRSKLANLMMANGMKEEAAELLLTTIDSYVRTGQTERALEECKKLRNLAPNSAPIRIQYGELLNRLERHTEALGEFRRALELEPTNIRALCLLNITLFLTDQSEVRWTSFKTVLDEMASNNEARGTIMNEYRQALFLFNHAALNYASACINLEAKLKPQAIRSLEETLRMAVNDPAMQEFEILARWELGQTYLDSLIYDKAVDELSKTINLLEAANSANYAPSTMRYGSLPTQLTIYRKLAQAFMKQGQVPYALKALKTVKRLLPYDREVYFELAELHFQQGQLSEALAELGELSDHYERLNQTDNVVEVLKEMVRLAPSRIEVRDKLSQVYLNRGMIDDGLAEIDELAELQRKNGRMKDAVRSLQRGAEIYFMMGKQDKAYGLYDRIVRIAPGDIEARQQLVNLHILGMRLGDAIEEQRTIAQICLQSGNTNDAIGALHQLIGLAPEDTRAYFQLADVLKSVGEFGQAFKLYGRVVKLEPTNEKAKTLQGQMRQKAIEAGQIKEDKGK